MEIRKEKEKEFHDILRSKKQKTPLGKGVLDSRERWYSIEARSRFFIELWLKQRCPGKRVLDYGCGTAHVAIKISRMGAEEVIGIDISDVSIENANAKAVKEGFEKKCKFFVMDAEQMQFPDDYFDIVHENGSLHHLELNRAYQELARVLKPDGAIICIEPIGYNPLINFYRRITPHLRTEWEMKHILRKKDIEIAKAYFTRVEILNFFHLADILAVPFCNTGLFSIMLKFLGKIDSLLLKLPFLKWQAWQVIFMLSEPVKEKGGR